MTINLIDSEVHIQKVLTAWRDNHLKSEMITIDPRGVKKLDIQRAKRHYRFIQLYDILFNSLSLYNRKKDYLTTPISQRHELLLKEANEIFDELEIKKPLSEIVEDFNSSRGMMKKTFQGIFELYGIPLNEKMLEVIFGRALSPEKTKIDSIRQFTNGTRFNYDLRFQFGTTKSMKGTGIFSIFFMRSAGLLGLDGTNYNPIAIEDAKYFKSLSPLWSENTITRILVKAALSTQIS